MKSALTVGAAKISSNDGGAAACGCCRLNSELLRERAVKNLSVFALLIGSVVSTSPGAVTSSILSPMISFGGGDGWLAPGERSYLTTNDNQAGLAFNRVSGHLLLVNRAGGLSIPILDSVTGTDVGTLNAAIVPFNPGVYPLHMISVANSGAIYAANVADSATAQFRIYQWDNEASAPFLSYQQAQGTARLGDAMDVTVVDGVDWLAVSAAPGISGGTYNGYFMFTTSGGAPFSATSVQFPSNPPAPGDHRLGLTFLGNDRVMGTPGGIARLSSLTYEGNYGLQSATFTGSATLQSASERPMDFAVIGGTPVLATLDTSTSMVRLYDMTVPLTPMLLDAHTNIFGPSNANSTGVGEVCFGSIDGNTATLYALNANNGVQAFNVAIPEPAGATFIALAALALARRRR